MVTVQEEIEIQHLEKEKNRMIERNDISGRIVFAFKWTRAEKAYSIYCQRLPFDSSMIENQRIKQEKISVGNKKGHNGI